MRLTIKEKFNILQYTKNHTWKETCEKYNISPMSLSRWNHDEKIVNYKRPQSTGKHIKIEKNTSIEKKIIKKVLAREMLIDEFNQLKTYFRKGNRPGQIKAVQNFEKHLRSI